MEILTISTPSLGNRSHVIAHDGKAIVVDPQRDLDRVTAVLDEHGLIVTDVVETHVHNDYVTGGFQLAQQAGARYHVAADANVAYEHVGVRDGDVLELGDGEVQLRAVHTPGHTPDHLSWVLAQGGRDVAVFTGGSMLFGSVGRTDLVPHIPAEELTRHQHRSVRMLANDLDGAVEVRPTHGFGSFCSSGDTSGVEESDIARERSANQACTIDDEDEFVETLLAGLDAYPDYYRHMAPANSAGPAPIDLSPPATVELDELRRRIADGEWVVDVRGRDAFARRHLRGTINFELSDSASTYLGWTIPWGTPVTILADDAKDAAELQRQLVRIGIDRPAGQHLDVTSTLEQLAQDDPNALGGYDVVAFVGLTAALEDQDLWVLDARRNLEWAAGHLPGGHHIPLHELLDRLDEVPTGRKVWVHCASGYRASIAASFLTRSGREPVLVDGNFDDEGRRHLGLTDASAMALA